MHSHYGKEHYCPVSMFRAYGTSEFEVLEEESHNVRPVEEDDVYEDVSGMFVLDDLKSCYSITHPLIGRVAMLFTCSLECFYQSVLNVNSSLILQVPFSQKKFRPRICLEVQQKL